MTTNHEVILVLILLSGHAGSPVLQESLGGAGKAAGTGGRWAGGTGRTHGGYLPRVKRTVRKHSGWLVVALFL